MEDKEKQTAEELTTEQKMLYFQNMPEIEQALYLFYAVFLNAKLETHINLFPSFEDGKFIWSFETKEYRQQQMEEYATLKLQEQAKEIEYYQKESEHWNNQAVEMGNKVTELNKEIERLKGEKTCCGLASVLMEQGCC